MKNIKYSILFFAVLATAFPTHRLCGMEQQGNKGLWNSIKSIFSGTQHTTTASESTPEPMVVDSTVGSETPNLFHDGKSYPVTRSRSRRSQQLGSDSGVDVFETEISNDASIFGLGGQTSSTESSSRFLKRQKLLEKPKEVIDLTGDQPVTHMATTPISVDQPGVVEVKSEKANKKKRGIERVENPEKDKTPEKKIKTRRSPRLKTRRQSTSEETVVVGENSIIPEGAISLDELPESIRNSFSREISELSPEVQRQLFVFVSCSNAIVGARCRDLSDQVHDLRQDLSGQLSILSNEDEERHRGVVTALGNADRRLVSLTKEAANLRGEQREGFKEVEKKQDEMSKDMGDGFEGAHKDRGGMKEDITTGFDNAEQRFEKAEEERKVWIRLFEERGRVLNRVKQAAILGLKTFGGLTLFLCVPFTGYIPIIGASSYPTALLEGFIGGCVTGVSSWGVSYCKEVIGNARDENLPVVIQLFSKTLNICTKSLSFANSCKNRVGNFLGSCKNICGKCGRTCNRVLGVITCGRYGNYGHRRLRDQNSQQPEQPVLPALPIEGQIDDDEEAVESDAEDRIATRTRKSKRKRDHR